MRAEPGKYEKCFNLGAGKFHFGKYEKFFRGGFFFRGSAYVHAAHVAA